MKSKEKTLKVHYFKVVPIVNEEYYIKAQNEITEAFELPENKEYENVYQTYGEVGLFGSIKRKKNYILGTFSYA